MKTAYDIIIRPVITEQSMEATELKKYVFLVAESANKTEIKLALERTPPQIHRHILSEGIYITGGSTRLANLDRFLTRQLGCTVQLSQYYDLCTICGLKELITHDTLHKWAYTVKKHNHR